MSDGLEKAMQAEASQAGLRVAEADELPQVRIDPDLNITARRLGELVARLDLFKQNGELVWFDSEGDRQEMTPHIFRTWINQHAVLFYKSDKDGEPVRATLKLVDASSILTAPAFLRAVRRLEGENHVRLPVIVQGESGPELELLPWGYHEGTGIYTVPGGLEYEPGKDLACAKGWLARLFRSFPFSDDRSQAVQVAAMLSLYLRHILPPRAIRKGVLWLANKSESGKSVLAKAALYPVLGHAAAAAMKKGEEFDKEMEGFTRAAVPYIFLDNVYGSIANARLDQMMTSTESTFRAMGGQQIVRLPNVAQLLVTGNRLELNEDAENRFLIVDLFEEGDPREREMEFLLDDQLMSSDAWRREALESLHALVAHWCAKGCPPGPRVDGRAPDFTRLMGGIALACGFADPIQRPVIPDAINPERAQFAELLEAVLEEMGEEVERDWTLEQLARVARARGLFGDRVGTEEQGRKLTIREEGLKGDERAHAIDFGYLTPQQRQRWNGFIRDQLGEKPVIKGRRVAFGKREQSRKTTYTIRAI